MNGVGRITENKWMRRLRSDLRIVLDLILRSDLRFGPAQNKHLVVRTDGHWPFRASGLLGPLARLAKEGEKICLASGQMPLALFHFIIVLPNINKLMILADGERMLSLSLRLS